MGLSVRMSVAVSMSMNQSSSCEKSCPLNVEISCSMVTVRCDSLCVAHKVSLYAYIVSCIGSSLGFGADYGWSIIVRCCSLSVTYISSAVGVDWGAVDFRPVN